MAKFLFLSVLLAASASASMLERPAGLPPMHPGIFKQREHKRQSEEPLYLTPYIERGDIATARQLSEVTDLLEGVSEADQPTSYSGLFTVKPDTDNNIFFWFIEATEVAPEDAPVVVWLQGGPGSSSLFGAFELHGPIISVDGGPEGVTGVRNEWAWTRRANMLYIDNPVGAGFSYAGDNQGLPSDVDQSTDDLYEMLVQFFTIFEDFQPNDFYPFGESYGGKWVPNLARRIHDRNQDSPDVFINLAGMGIGDGFMSPRDTAVYAEVLYEASLVDEPTRDRLLGIEDDVKDACDEERWQDAFNLWNNEFTVFLNAMGCSYYYEMRQCNTDPEEDNYADYVDLPDNRDALHVGDLAFGGQSTAVYVKMEPDFMTSQQENIEFLLDRYDVLIYDGNLDVICNHYGILKMFDEMETWSDIDEFRDADKDLFRVGGRTAGYVTAAGNLRLVVMRNAGHMVPRSQPEYAYEMFSQFLDGDL